MYNRGMRNTPHFCILPFLHMEIQPNGQVYVCCHSNDQVPIGNLHEKSLLEIWTSEGVQKVREAFLSGQGNKNKHCQDCFFQESIGMDSWRIKENENWNHYLDNFHELDGIPFPKSLSIRFSNLCNFSCRTCKPSTSTAWFADAKFMNPKGKFVKLTSAPASNPLIEQVKPFVKHLQHIYFAGGEPLMEMEHYEIIKLFSEENPDVNLSYDTNFSLFSLGKHNAFDYWPKFSKLFLSTSVDGFGPKGEYIRKGFEWEEFKKNWQLARQKLPKAKLKMNFTLSIYNCLHVLDTVEEFKRLKLLSDGDLDISLVEEPRRLSIAALPKDLKIEVEKRYREYMRINDWAVVNKKLEDAMAYMNSIDDSILFPEFKSFTKQLDLLRSEDFTDLFEEEAKMFDLKKVL
jgi:radical SAM protein with 4Fe4S-binding SPASM domain